MKEIKTEKAPKAVGPYSQAIYAGDFLFCSGQIGVNPQTNEIVKGGVKSETEQVLKNLSAILEKSGAKLSDVVRCDIFIKDMGDYKIVNEIYGKYFSQDPKPARQTVEVSKLPKDALIEISCIAYLKNE
jgi:2-iminobutanoate/2-iminopropanoate deaminase